MIAICVVQSLRPPCQTLSNPQAITIAKSDLHTPNPHLKEYGLLIVLILIYIRNSSFFTVYCLYLFALLSINSRCAYSFTLPKISPTIRSSSTPSLTSTPCGCEQLLIRNASVSSGMVQKCLGWLLMSLL